MFIGRENELTFLNSVIAWRHPGPAQLILLYGRRRFGKTCLLLQWTARAGVPFTIRRRKAPRFSGSGVSLSGIYGFKMRRLWIS